MDRLDLAIMKTLLVNNGVPLPGNPALKKSFRSMAKELGVDQGTIRKRMKRFQERRVLKGWFLGVSPALTGQDVYYAWFTIEDESEKEEAIERLLTLPNLERACNYLGPKLKMILLCDKGADMDEVTDQLARLAGPRATLRNRAFLEVPQLFPKEVDMAIVGSLRKDPWKPYPDVAKEVGLSARTVRRRVEMLSEGGEIYMLPAIDYKALQGVIPADLIVEYHSREAQSHVNERITGYIGEKLMFAGNFGPVGYFALMLSNVSHVEEISGWVRRQPGVREAQVDVLKDVVLNRRHFEGKQASAQGEAGEYRASGLVGQTTGYFGSAW